MKIEKVEMVCSAPGLAECPRNRLVEIAVSGRSNVGKSSLLNNLLGRTRIARVSSTPGKTQLLHYVLVNKRFHLVDLPGYGYARAPHAVRTRWREMMHEYLRHREELRGVIQLLDARHESSRQDREMIEWLLEEKLDFCLVPTKMDKLRRGERKGALARLLDGLSLPPSLPMVPYSSRTGEGRRELLAWLERAVSAPRTADPT